MESIRGMSRKTQISPECQHVLSLTGESFLLETLECNDSLGGSSRNFFEYQNPNYHHENRNENPDGNDSDENSRQIYRGMRNTVSEKNQKVTTTVLTKLLVIFCLIMILNVITHIYLQRQLRTVLLDKILLRTDHDNCNELREAWLEKHDNFDKNVYLDTVRKIDTKAHSPESSSGPDIYIFPEKNAEVWILFTRCSEDIYPVWALVRVIGKFYWLHNRIVVGVVVYWFFLLFIFRELKFLPTLIEHLPICHCGFSAFKGYYYTRDYVPFVLKFSVVYSIVITIVFFDFPRLWDFSFRIIWNIIAIRYFWIFWFQGSSSETDPNERVDCLLLWIRRWFSLLSNLNSPLAVLALYDIQLFANRLLLPAPMLFLILEGLHLNKQEQNRAKIRPEGLPGLARSLSRRSLNLAQSQIIPRNSMSQILPQRDSGVPTTLQPLGETQTEPSASPQILGKKLLLKDSLKESQHERSDGVSPRNHRRSEDGQHQICDRSNSSSGGNKSNEEGIPRAEDVAIEDTKPIGAGKTNDVEKARQSASLDRKVEGASLGSSKSKFDSSVTNNVPMIKQASTTARSVGLTTQSVGLPLFSTLESIRVDSEKIMVNVAVANCASFAFEKRSYVVVISVIISFVENLWTPATKMVYLNIWCTISAACIYRLLVLSFRRKQRILILVCAFLITFWSEMLNAFLLFRLLVDEPSLLRLVGGFLALVLLDFYRETYFWLHVDHYIMGNPKDNAFGHYAIFQRNIRQSRVIEMAYVVVLVGIITETAVRMIFQSGDHSEERSFFFLADRTGKKSLLHGGSLLKHLIQYVILSAISLLQGKLGRTHNQRMFQQNLKELLQKPLPGRKSGILDISVLRKSLRTSKKIANNGISNGIESPLSDLLESPDRGDEAINEESELILEEKAKSLVVELEKLLWTEYLFLYIYMGGCAIYIYCAFVAIVSVVRL